MNYFVRVFVFACGVSFLTAESLDLSVKNNIPSDISEGPSNALSDFSSPSDNELDILSFPSIGTEGKGVLYKILFTNSIYQKEIEEEPVTSRAIVIDGVDLIQNHESFIHQLENTYLGKTFTKETVSEINKQVLDFYFKQEHPIVYVMPTLAHYDKGELHLCVIEARVDQKIADGARWFDNSKLLAKISLESGEYINRTQLLNELAWINQNPFLQSELLVKPGNLPGTTNIILESKDRFPLRVFLEVDNTGSTQTGVNRWTVGMNWGNAFFLGHQLNYQFSAALKNIHSQPVHSGSYIAHLPWHHKFSVYGSYARTDMHLNIDTGAEMKYGGYQSQISPRYTVPIGKLYGRFIHDVTLGLDCKSTDLFFLQGGLQIPSNKTSIRQLMASYSAIFSDTWGQTTFGCELFWSPGGIGKLNTNKAFESVNPYLQANYLYGVLVMNRETRLYKNFCTNNQLTVQWANTSLISSEQISIGGWNTVRGYEERILFGDQGMVFNTELHFPHFSIGSLLGKKWAKDETLFLSFWDFGLVNDIYPLPDDKATYYITSVGCGFRYNLSNYMKLRIDLGFPLINPDLDVLASHCISFGIVAGY